MSQLLLEAVVRTASVNYTQKQLPVGVIEKKGVLRNLAKFTGKQLCQNFCFNNVSKNRLCHRCFPVNFAKFSRTNFFIEYFWCLLLECICIEV